VNETKSVATFKVFSVLFNIIIIDFIEILFI
jgi:hypothetical protein